MNDTNLHKIQNYDKKYNIQQLFFDGKKIKEIANEIPCDKKELKNYCKSNNIVKPISYYNVRNTTNTGVRYLSLLPTGMWQYRHTYKHPNNITKDNLKDIKKIVLSNGYFWQVDDENKLKQAINQSKLYREIQINKIDGKKVANNRKSKRNKQKNLRKKALNVFKKMFANDDKIAKSNTGVANLRFNKGDNSWIFNKNSSKGVIKRQKIDDLYKEVVSQGYDWVIEDSCLLHNVIEEVELYRKEVQKPILERKNDFKFI